MHSAPMDDAIPESPEQQTQREELYTLHQRVVRAASWMITSMCKLSMARSRNSALRPSSRYHTTQLVLLAELENRVAPSSDRTQCG